MDLRRVGLLAALLATLALLFLRASGDAPSNFEQWMQDGGGARVLAARGAGVARYDPTEGVTFVVFACAHWYCPDAVRIAGDAREAAGSFGVTLLRAPAEPPSRMTTPMSAPIPLPGPDAAVRNATVETFTIVQPWPGIARLDVAFAFISGGVALAWHGQLRRAALASVGALLGALVALPPLRSGSDTIFFFLGLTFLGFLALGGLAGLTASRFPRLASGRPLLLAASAGLLFAWVTQADFFPPWPTA